MNMKGKTKTTISDAIDVAFDIVDGIDGWMSEKGDFPDFWEMDILHRYDKIVASINKLVGKTLTDKTEIAIKKKVSKLLIDLMDGLEGVVSEQGEVPRKFWKRNVLTRGKAALRALKRASTASSRYVA